MFEFRRLIPFFPLAQFILSLYQYGLPMPIKTRLLGIWFLKLVFLEPFRWLGEWRWLFTKGLVPEDPIFVLGFYRSATTYLQQLLSRDPAMATLTLFHSVVPELMGLREFFLPLFKFVARVRKLKNDYHRLPLEWTFPGEDDVVINASVCEGDFNKLFQYPSAIDKTLGEYIDFTNQRKKVQWMKDHRRLVSRLAAVNRGKRLVLKSPPHTGRVALLKEMYPKAKFIFIHRKPSEVIVSTRRIWDLNRRFCFESYTEGMADSYSIKLYHKLQSKYLEEKGILQPDDLVEVAFDDFVKYTENELKRIYSTLGLPGIEEAMEHFNGLITERTNYLLK